MVTNSERDRPSLVEFCLPKSDKEVGPIDELISEESPRLHKMMTTFADILFQHYEHGTKQIDAAKL